ncbi:RHOMBOID-like protein 2 isoform X3 [Physcomitrium patens]|uniref:RHOMBOID-like protein 2 isoform X3 n=1 Tax=Physcomitrium patens TaxID=3218 RepID=UPI003CCDC64A
MADIVSPSLDSSRRQKSATLEEFPLPDSHRKRTQEAQRSRACSDVGFGEYRVAMVQQPLQGFDYVSPLRSLHMPARPCTYKSDAMVPVTTPKANPGHHHQTASSDLVSHIRQRYGQKREIERGQTSWLIPALALIHLIAFILVMSHNNCDRKGSNGGENVCIFNFVRRFPFQPLSENPLLGPSAISLLDFGALESELVGRAGEGWRMLTTLSLHAGIFHLVGNLAGLFYVGLQLEREFGFLKVMLIYYLAGFAGALASVLFMHGRVSVGASGATMGLIGARLAEVVMNWNVSKHRTRSIVSTSFFLVGTLVYGLLPLMDNFMHLGGFLTGSLLGNVLLIRPQAEWVNYEQCFPAVVYDVDDLPARSKHSRGQKVLWIVSLNILVAGYIAAAFALYTGMDARRRCSWCHYMACIPTDLWKCHGNRNIMQHFPR